MSEPYISPSLAERHEKALKAAEEAEKLYGNPVDRLIAALEEFVTDSELWEQIVNAPYCYGCDCQCYDPREE